MNVQAPSEGVDELVGVGHFGGLHDLFVGHLLARPVLEIFPDGSSEEVSGLVDDGHAVVVAPGGMLNFAHIFHNNV